MGTKRILLIEDQWADALLLEALLFDAGVSWELKQAQTFAEAQVAWVTATYDAVLLDLDLPDGYGLELLQRALALAGQVPVIVLSGNVDPDLSTKVLDLGGAGHVAKGEQQLADLIRLLERTWRTVPSSH
ncbi:response regulator [Deinococcus hohokamensis]|uniref:Response regulator n=1 Tax=Deinococcus hohokamensis TaxID=309883 RepID=A0ABV9I7H8_9DEIO